MSRHSPRCGRPPRCGRASRRTRRPTSSAASPRRLRCTEQTPTTPRRHAATPQANRDTRRLRAGPAPASAERRYAQPDANATRRQVSSPSVTLCRRPVDPGHLAEPAHNLGRETVRRPIRRHILADRLTAHRKAPRPHPIQESRIAWSRSITRRRLATAAPCPTYRRPCSKALAPRADYPCRRRSTQCSFATCCRR